MPEHKLFIDQRVPVKENNPESIVLAASRQDAFEPVAQSPPVQDSVRDTRSDRVARVSNPDLTTLSDRDRAALRQVVLFRILTYAQLRRIAYVGVHASVARRRMRQLATAGWLKTHEFPQRHGGHQRYAHPATPTIKAFLAEIASSAKAEVFAPLVRLMLPPSGRRPLELSADGPPKWLPHQREVNHLLATTLTSRPGILWASSWDCPFPNRQGMFTLPQPDYVVVDATDGGPRLIFGEHDRGSDKKFGERKVELYSALAQFPEACEEFFGFRSFSVHVTVIDPVRQRPIERMRELMRIAQAAGATNLFRFTLGGWLFAYGPAAIWFDAAHGPSSDSVTMRDHESHMVA